MIKHFMRNILTIQALWCADEMPFELCNQWSVVTFALWWNCLCDDCWKILCQNGKFFVKMENSLSKCGLYFFEETGGILFKLCFWWWNKWQESLILGWVVNYVEEYETHGTVQDGEVMVKNQRHDTVQDGECVVKNQRQLFGL